MPRRIGINRAVNLLGRYVTAKISGRPYVLNIEVTYACNARCNHCNCWRIDPGDSLSDFRDVVKQFKPIIVWFTGGEPLMRTDICQIIQGIREQNRNTYLGLSTNGWLLDRDVGLRLLSAGLDQINISIDYLYQKHDEHRGIAGLFGHIDNIITEIKELGIQVVITTSIMKDNMNSLLDILDIARRWGVEVGFSCYSDLKTGDLRQNIQKEDIDSLQVIISRLRRHRRKFNIIRTSDFFLRKIPAFFENGTIGKCQATKSWLYLSPKGYLKICPDKGIYAYYKDYAGPGDINCGGCWYTCRGEMEVPFGERIFWVFGDVIISRFRKLLSSE